VLLSVERSAVPGSAAIFSEAGTLLCKIEEGVSLPSQEPGLSGNPIKHRTVPRPSGDACSLVQSLLDKCQINIHDVKRLATGVGPGSYSGIRSAIAFLKGLSLPSNTQVQGVSSAMAAALALYLPDSDNADFMPMHVVGDARRGQIWVASCNTPFCIPEIILVPRAELVKTLSTDALIITPDWHRLGNFLTESFSSSRLRSSLPTAEAAGILALSGHTVPAAPLYMHRAVDPPKAI
jgi:tRNA threonylcarbamoyl adenosine modification protein YeaZ